MKKTKMSSDIANIPQPMKKSIYNSIIDTETMQDKDIKINRIASRVAMVNKVLFNRNLDALALDFENRINDVVMNFCTIIDNELSQSSSPKESAV